MKITKNTTLAGVLEIKGAEKVLSKFQVPCLGCAMAQMEMDTLRLGDICNMYGLNIEKILEELNKLLK